MEKVGPTRLGGRTDSASLGFGQAAARSLARLAGHRLEALAFAVVLALALVLGGLAGILAFNVPGTYYDAGYALLGFENATDALDYAQARTLELASVDWASVVMVSSAAK